MPDGFGKYDVYTTTGSIYCYAGTNVLRNRFGIRDGAVLKQIEADITAVRQHALLTQPIPGRFTPHHLCRIHRYLFGDLYPFSGHYRREGIAKGQTIFIPPHQIAEKLTLLLRELASERHLRQLQDEVFLDRLAYYFAELNYIHPFREGNGRSTREFIRQLLLLNGYTIDWSNVSVDRLLQAMEASVFDTAPLIQVLQICVTKDAR